MPYFVCQVQELHRKLSEETRRADNLAFEMKKFEEKHEALVKEKEVLPLIQMCQDSSYSSHGKKKKNLH